jgi:hypothetical protein
LAGASAALVCEELFNSVRVKADQNLVADDYRRRTPAIVFPDQFENRRLVGAYVLLYKLNSSILEERLCGIAGRSAGLREEYHFFRFAHDSSIRCSIPCERSSKT